MHECDGHNFDKHTSPSISASISALLVFGALHNSRQYPFLFSALRLPVYRSLVIQHEQDNTSFAYKNKVSDLRFAKEFEMCGNTLSEITMHPHLIYVSENNVPGLITTFSSGTKVVTVHFFVQPEGMLPHYMSRLTKSEG
eukprot:gb/GEZJ01007536.1/.p1 GENE.gb/GEZJ01007536.1/~~gb/GEZJ01007536.1/.p1  ORF type:complete len:140 (+),score=4.52 gb/GEZJ01007536.1/:215-634(+)